MLIFTKTFLIPYTWNWLCRTLLQHSNCIGEVRSISDLRSLGSPTATWIDSYMEASADTETEDKNLQRLTGMRQCWQEEISWEIMLDSLACMVAENNVAVSVVWEKESSNVESVESSWVKHSCFHEVTWEMNWVENIVAELWQVYFDIWLWRMALMTSLPPLLICSKAKYWIYIYIYMYSQSLSGFLPLAVIRTSTRLKSMCLFSVMLCPPQEFTSPK